MDVAGMTTSDPGQRDRSDCPSCYASPSPCPACAYREAIRNVEGAARELDALFEGAPGHWTLAGEKIDEEAVTALLSLHDYLNDVTFALTAAMPLGQERGATASDERQKPHA
jgi:hypothetical protein